MTKESILSKSSKIYHLYWEDRCIMRGVDEEDFHGIWEKLLYTYNTELNYVEITLDEDDNLAITDTSYWKSQKSRRCIRTTG